MEAAKRCLAMNDGDGLWRQEPRQPPATPEQVAEIAMVTCCAVDPEYADFLLHSNGWPAILQDIDLFGTADFGTLPYVEAKELLHIIETEGDVRLAANSSHLIPIGASRADIDIFAMSCASVPGRPAVVAWIAGGEIERYSSFREFFRGMIAENYAEAESLK
ncbi:hypothetical protein GCM10009716_46310 [Streptomyces sodiiphilus]|uniref:Knr4/Smi1-like domain-containing protein n=2 Tax=Streptomyces sodiiphilus TaxID=226217 RepID=A0ABN2PW07_9ACTN